MRHEDRIQRQIELQHQEFPDFDFSAKAITGRIIRLGTLFVEGLGQVVAPYGLTPNEYAVIAVLRASGRPYALAPKAINEALILTTGGLTNLLNSLVKRGLVERLPDPVDRRGVLIRASDKALDLIEAAIHAHLRKEHSMLSALDEAEQKQLEILLVKLTASLDVAASHLPQVSGRTGLA